MYGGQTSADRVAARRSRLIEACLDVMADQDSGQLTVRKVLDRSGVAPRYFYEEFDGLEQLQETVFDLLTHEAERRGLEAMRSAPRSVRARTRAVLQAMVDLLLDDPRKGHVLLVEPLSSPVLGPRQAQAVRRFAHLLAGYSPAVQQGAPADAHSIRLAAQFAMGGFTTAMTAVISGELTVSRDQLGDDLTTLFLAVSQASRRLNA